MSGVEDSPGRIRVENIKGRVLNRILFGAVTVLVTFGGLGHLPVTAAMGMLRCGLPDLGRLAENLQSIPSVPGPFPRAYPIFPHFKNSIRKGRAVPQSWEGNGRWLTVADRVSLGIVRPSEVYRTAYQDFVKGRYQLAVQQFEKFVEDFPTNSLAPQAYFYIGECYYNLGNFKLAAQNLSLIITRHKESREKWPNYQNGRQVPPALFRLGKVYEEAGKPEKAKAFWGILLTDFPNTPEAHLAKKRLTSLP